MRSNGAHPGFVTGRAYGYVALIAVSETGFAVTGVIEAECYDYGIGDDWGEFGLYLVSRLQYIDVYKAVKHGAYGRSHAPAFQVASQAIDVIVFAADNVAVEIEGFPFEAAGVMTKPFDVG